MSHHQVLDDKEKERRRRKQYKRMGKILGRMWQLDEETQAFQTNDDDDNNNNNNIILCLQAIGERLDQQSHYRLGRHGWEDFARDLGGVYNRHIIHSKTNKASLAKTHLETAKQLLGARDESLVKLASEHVPTTAETERPSSANGTAPSSSKKRKANDTAAAAVTTKRSKKKHHHLANKNKELAEREERAMELLSNFCEERGGSRSLVDGFRSRVTKKPSNGKFDTTFYSPEGRRFRSMLEVGRHFGLVKDGAGDKARMPVREKTGGRSREQEAEKKRLRKELDRLRKAHQRASKALDDFVTEEKESRYPVDDRILMEQEQEQQQHQQQEQQSSKTLSSSSSMIVTRATCAAARIPDVDGFPNVPQHCIPDVLMAWDFLCTFQRALSLTPIALDDFACALTYTPPEGQIGDDVVAPPVYLAEAHLGLLKLLLQDAYSDDWWWSTIETDESELTGAEGEDGEDDRVQEMRPVIKFDVAALLNEDEDPLITSSWMRALEEIGKSVVKGDAVVNAIKTALKVVSNKWVQAYLRKALHGRKTNGTIFMTQAVMYLVDRVREARPDLQDATVKVEQVQSAKEKVIEEATKQMEGLAASAPIVKSEDALSDVEYDDDEDSDDSDDEEAGKPADKSMKHSQDESERPASVVPPRPLPGLVDFLLPPSKPKYDDEYVNTFTWPQMVGAAARRVLHRRKRLLNEVDDYLRLTRELPPILVPERRKREVMVASRSLMECSESLGDQSPTEKAIEHLCNGGSYLQLSTVERLCILRLLIEAAYDTTRLHVVVDENIKQRTSAMKALDVEQRKAKRGAREKAAADETAAREHLSLEAKEKFLDEKREEIRQLNEKSKEFDDEIIESLTDEDIISFDEDFKADYDALPTPDSFNKTEVKQMVARMHEEAAFDTDSLRVLTLEDVLEREKRQLLEMEEQLLRLGGEDALVDPSLDRDTSRSIEKLLRDINKAKELQESLPSLREKAIEQLKDAMADGTIKVLRSAINAAKKAKLSGPDEETGGIWAMDLMRDAALELDNAKQNKRVLDAQRDLVAKRNKCFIRREPLGRDRFGNRFWSFENDDEGHVWVDAEYILKGESSSSEKLPPGFLDLEREPDSISYGARDMEEDLMGTIEKESSEAFCPFSRREHHSSGFTPTLAKNHWGCQATEESLRAVIKILDSRGERENELKKNLKESLEQTVGNDEKHESANDMPAANEDENAAEVAEAEASHVRDSEDEAQFQSTKEATIQKMKQAENGPINGALEIFVKLTTGIGQRVRVRQVVDESRDRPVARYETGSVNGWQFRQEEVTRSDENEMEDDEETFEPKTDLIQVPVWRVSTDRGHVVWLTGPELIESIIRYDKWVNSKGGYFEDDAAFLAYRNSTGRHCGRASDAPYACSPIFFARLMVKRESELYPKLKIRSYDNNWGGKSGSRALWTNSMKDYAFDFQTAKQGLLTLENAIFELTGEFSDYENVSDDVPDAKALLADPATRIDIELEAEKNIPGLWSSPASRAVFIEIVSNCSTTGFLALALDLLCRNTTNYLKTHKLLNVKTESSFYEPVASRRTRRMNAWQRQQQVSYEEFF